TPAESHPGRRALPLLPQPVPALRARAHAAHAPEPAASFAWREPRSPVRFAPVRTAAHPALRGRAEMPTIPVEAPGKESRPRRRWRTAASVAIVSVSCAVFVPTSFITGISGAFYQQFAVTISTATVISSSSSSTSSPAAAASSLRPKHGSAANDPAAPRWKRVSAQAGDRFNTGFDRSSDRYGRLTRWSSARRKKVSATYAASIVATIGSFWATPGGFIPAQDQGYFSAVVQSPPGASSERTDAVTR
ncbi:hypothetical protein OY671_008374, partial [Metschnikowia pulcherrima]